MQTTSYQLEAARPVRQSRSFDPFDCPALKSRIELLRREDQLILQLALRAGASRRQIGRLLNVPGGSVTRRMQAISRKLHDPLVIALLRDDCPLPPVHRQIGVEQILQSLSATELSRRHDLPVTQVRRIIAYLHGWHRGRGTP